MSSGLNRYCMFCPNESIGYICEKCFKRNIIKCQTCNNLVIDRCMTCTFFKVRKSCVEKQTMISEMLYQYALENQKKVSEDMENIIIGLASGKTINEVQQSLQIYTREDRITIKFLGKPNVDIYVNREKDTFGYLFYMISKTINVELHRINLLVNSQIINDTPIDTPIKDCVENVVLCTYIL